MGFEDSKRLGVALLPTGDGLWRSALTAARADADLNFRRIWGVRGNLPQAFGLGGTE